MGPSSYINNNSNNTAAAGNGEDHLCGGRSNATSSMYNTNIPSTNNNFGDTSGVVQQHHQIGSFVGDNGDGNGGGSYSNNSYHTSSFSQQQHQGITTGTTAATATATNTNRSRYKLSTSSATETTQTTAPATSSSTSSGCRPAMLKRDTSHKCENSETKRDTKRVIDRSLLNRGSSLTKVSEGDMKKLSGAFTRQSSLGTSIVVNADNVDGDLDVGGASSLPSDSNGSGSGRINIGNEKSYR